MGIRFACHACAKSLNIKNELAGKRGVCPQCGTKFRIPSTDAPQSIPLELIESPAVQTPPELSPVAREAFSEQATAPEPAARVEQSVDQPKATVSTETIPNAKVTAASLLDDPVAVWYVRPPSGGQYGPASGDMLRNWIQEARVTGTSLIWRDGWAQWRSASEVLSEFGAHEANASAGVSTVSNAQAVNGAPAQRSASGVRPVDAVAPSLSGDSSIGKLKSKRTGNRFVMIGTLAALSMTLIGVLIYLIQR
jgi:hypothetical protein